MSVGRTIREGFTLCGRGYGRLCALALLGVAVDAAAGFFTTNAAGQHRTALPAIESLVAVPFWSWVYLAMLAGAVDAGAGGTLTLPKLLMRPWGKFWRYIGNTALLTGCCVLVVIIVIVTFLLILVAVAQGRESGEPGGRGVVLTLIVCGLPVAAAAVAGMIWLGVRLGVYGAAIVMEPPKPKRLALGRSWTLMRHHVWRGLLIWLAFWACGVLAPLISVLGIAWRLGAVSRPEFSWAGMVLSVLVTPVGVGMEVALYRAVVSEEQRQA